MLFTIAFFLARTAAKIGLAFAKVVAYTYRIGVRSEAPGLVSVSIDNGKGNLVSVKACPLGVETEQQLQELKATVNEIIERLNDVAEPDANAKHAEPTNVQELFNSPGASSPGLAAAHPSPGVRRGLRPGQRLADKL